MDRNDDLVRIIEGCKAGDAESFSRLIDIYGRRCYGYFYRLTGNRELSDDLLGELFVKLVEKIGSYRGGSFESWLFRIATNIFHDHLRDKQRRGKLLKARKEQVEAEGRGGKGPDDERVDKLQKQLEKLEAGTRELIMLRYYSELSFREIAEMRGVPVGTVLSKVHRGLKRLRELMEQ